MFKKKRLLAAGLVMSMAITGCGNESGADPTPTPTQAETPTKAPEPTNDAEPTQAPAEPTAAPTPTQAPSYEAGKVADFEDGNMSFAAVKETLVTSAETELSVVDFAGSKALQAAAADTAKFPYIAIDVSSLAGDAIESVRTIEMDMGLAAGDGNFYAASGYIYYYIGQDNTEKNATWSVYLDTKNPKRVSFTLADDESFVSGAKNIIIISKETDNAIGATGATNTVYIDNIVLKDADGNAIELNTAAAFDAPAGFADMDWSNLVQVKDEVELAGMAGKTEGSWWPAGGITTDIAQTNAELVGEDAVSMDKYVDPATFGPGMYMTVYCSFDAASLDEWQRNIKLVGQYYEVEGSEVGAPAWEAGYKSEDGKAEFDGVNLSYYGLTFNDSYTIAQLSYDDVAQYFGEDWFKYMKFLGIADYGFVLDISKVTVGYEKKVLPATINDVNIEGFAVKEAGWAQAGVDRTEDGGTFDYTLLKPGSVVTINYKSEGSMWLVAVPVNGASFEWTRIAQFEAAVNDDNNACQITYEQIVDALQTEDFSQIAKLQCESDQEWEVFSVTIGEYAPEALKFTDEVMIDGTNVSAGEWGQAGATSLADGGTFDYTLLVPGTVINVYYKENGGKYWLVAVPSDGASYGWSRVGNGDNDVVSRMDPSKGICQITYDQLVKALGTDDFSTMYALQVESDQNWEIYGIGIAKLAE